MSFPEMDAMMYKIEGEDLYLIGTSEHSVIGGLGSAVSECVSQKAPCKIYMVGQKDTFGESGKPEELKAKYGMTASDIYKAVHVMMK